MARAGSLATILVCLAAAGCARHDAGARAVRVARDADPVLVRGFATGSASHGPHCRAPYASEAFDRECALVYAVDASGHFRQIREYRDPRAPGIASHLVLGADGRVYGVTSVVGTGDGAARPTLFRYSPREARFEIVHRFAPDERVLGIGAFAVDAAGVAYAFATIDAVRDRADAALLRITPHGASVLARFGNVEPVGAPQIARDGTITGTLADRATCAGTRVSFEPLAARRPPASAAIFRSTERAIATGCRARTNAREGRAANGDRIVLYAERFAQFGPSRIRTTSLPVPFGHFSGAPISGPSGEAYALASGSNGSVCMRLVRVARDGVDVLHTFRHEDGWCLPPSICLFPRVKATDDRIDVTTARGAPCATNVSIATARSFDGIFGSVVHVAPSGAIRFAFADPR